MSDKKAAKAETLDPEEELQLQVYCANNAGKSPSSRFGRVEFDADGYGELTCKAKDLATLEAWKWLLPEDRKRFNLIGPNPVDADEKVDSEKLRTESKRMKGDLDTLNKEVAAAVAAGDKTMQQLRAAEARVAEVEAENKSLAKENERLVTAAAKAKKKDDKKGK